MNPTAKRLCKYAAHNILWYYGKLIDYDKLIEVVDDNFSGCHEAQHLSPVDCAGAYEFVKMLVAESSIEIHTPSFVERF